MRSAPTSAISNGGAPGVAAGHTARSYPTCCTVTHVARSESPRVRPVARTRTSARPLECHAPSQAPEFPARSSSRRLLRRMPDVDDGSQLVALAHTHGDRKALPGLGAQPLPSTACDCGHRDVHLLVGGGGHHGARRAHGSTPCLTSVTGVLLRPMWLRMLSLWGPRKRNSGSKWHSRARRQR